ncbi:hypothetical protein DPMN_189677 [Dreissena polymorpha]|uniref:Uncharacterized protein n=1 Tax=Dreissena polymorpha TaxID=45954 RepID=A0A9D4DUI2_DREPO|nr:hypothetical protein DPMN_189677 [Dreissena polymorpha]
MCTIIKDSGRRLHSDRGYTTPTLSMTCVMCTIIQDSSRRLHSDRGYTIPTLSMTCVMCTIIQDSSRRLHSGSSLISFKKASTRRRSLRIAERNTK